MPYSKLNHVLGVLAPASNSHFGQYPESKRVNNNCYFGLMVTVAITAAGFGRRHTGRNAADGGRVCTIQSRDIKTKLGRMVW